MGATKINTRHLSGIETRDLVIRKFRLMKNDTCRFDVARALAAGDVVLVKASFKNACEAETEEEDERVLFRRRVVPFVTRVARVAGGSPGESRITARIENMTDADRRFFMDKYFSADSKERAGIEIEARLIDFLPQ
ncbi:hypothetical protein K8I61_19275 [bacterium]|nr:hypothetical protein [bacterium]